MSFEQSVAADCLHIGLDNDAAIARVITISKLGTSYSHHRIRIVRPPANPFYRLPSPNIQASRVESRLEQNLCEEIQYLRQIGTQAAEAHASEFSAKGAA